MKFTFAPESKPLDGYTIKRAIYRGGFGEVYYALSDAGREVALKLLQNNTEIELRGVQQCLNLSHPNLVTIFDIKTDQDGDHWIVMEYVAGETLDKAIRRFPGGMPMEEIRRWLRGMAEGVSYLHEHGLVHRDLKPANVFSDSSGVKIGDVGLSKFITPSRRSAQTQSVGTVYYMAPEVAKGRYGKEVDVYALGIILYEMLTGHVPFEGDSTGEILMKHLTERPDLRKLPPRLRPVIGRALEKDPARRQVSMTELLRSFEDAVLGRTSTSSEPHPANARYDEVPPDRIRYRPVVGAEHRRRDRGRHWERAGKSRWRYAGAPSHPSELFFATLKWVMLAVVFHWIGWDFFVPVTLTLAAVFGIMFVMRLIRWSIFGLADGVHGAFREAHFAASKIGWAAQYAAGAAVAAPRAVGNAADAARGFCTKRFRGAAERPATTTLMRWTQWTGTAAVTTLVAGAFTAVLAVVWPRFAPLPNALTPTEWPELMMFAATVVLASWGITAATKFWDGTRSRLLPRLSLGLVGLAVGAGVWNLERFMHISLIRQPSLFDFGTNPVIASYASDIRVDRELLSTMVFFGLLFFARNWMRQSSVNRSSRLRLSSLVLTSLVAAAVAWLTSSRNIELMMTWAAVVSATVQVASAWSPPEKIERQAA